MHTYGVPYALNVPKTRPVRCSEELNPKTLGCGWHGRRIYDGQEQPCPKCGGRIEVGIRQQDYDYRYRVLWQEWSA